MLLLRNIVGWVCASKKFDYNEYAGIQTTGWALGSSGCFRRSGVSEDYCPLFVEDNSKITVHLNMKKIYS